MMPRLSGYEVCEKIREQIPARLLPVILLTAKNQLEDLLVGFRSGANDYLIKPFSKHELLARVKTHIELLKANRELVAHGQFLEQRVEKRTAELKSKNARLKDLNREKDGIIGMVAHDLKSPFNNISGLMYLMPLVGELTKEQKNYIDQVNGLVERSKLLIQDLLDANAFEGKSTIVNLEEFEVNKFVLERLNAYNPELEAKKQELNVVVEQNELRFTTDKSFIGRIIDNLISNAIKFSDIGTRIDVKLQFEEGNLILSVKDEGPGIEREERKKLFKKFQKLSAKPTGGESSNGLGLSIVKSLVTKLGGTIDVDSEPGNGATFIVMLPEVWID